MAAIHFLALLFTSLTAVVLAASSSEWKSRTIYQVLTDRFSRSDGSTSPCSNLGNYCGGTFKGLQNNLDYILGMGFDAIWISPVVENTPGGYHGYWASNLYEINSNFGSKADLVSLVSAMHKKGMWLMLDVVGNHMGGNIGDIGGFNPFNSGDDYHNCNGCDGNCNINNFNNQPMVQHCRLAGLPDLNQTNLYVRDTLKSWISGMVSDYSVDGLRIDTVPEVEKDFWGEFQQSAGTYAVGECFNGDINYVAPYQSASIGKPGLTGMLSYPMFYTLRNVFQQKQSMNGIQTQVSAYSQKLADPALMGTFLDNHDNARFLNGQSDVALFKAGMAYVLFSTGIPIIYYGSEQYYAGGNDPNCREPLWTDMNTNSDGYKFVSTLVNFRKKAAVWNEAQVQRYSDDSFYAFTRGSTFVALTNAGSNSGGTQRTITYHPYADGTKICNLFYPTSDCVTVSGGKFEVYLLNGEVKVYSPNI